MTTKNDDGASSSARHTGKLATISYGWASPVTRKRPAQSSCFQTLIKYFKLYCRHTSLVGLKYLVEDRATWIERILWILVYSCTVYVVFYFSVIFYQDFVNMSITTTLEGQYFPTQKLEFPGVAICSMNRLSRRSATILANEMLDANITTLSIDKVLRSILQLGDLYDTSFMPDDDYTGIIELLTKMYGKDYDVTEIMKRLTPPCSDVLQFCSFHDENRNCSELFTLRKTQDGFCCTFNYIVQINKLKVGKMTKSPSAYKVENISPRFGLNLVLDPLLDDYFYRLLPLTGWKMSADKKPGKVISSAMQHFPLLWKKPGPSNRPECTTFSAEMTHLTILRDKVMIFNPHDYPDKASGGVTEILVAPLSEMYVQLHAFGLHSTDAIRSFPIEKRRCFFPHEKQFITSMYTGSDCILACKIEDTWRACNCRPFFWPSQEFAKETYRTCSPKDIHCMEKHKSEVRHFIPFTSETVQDRMKNENDTFYCPNCYLSCDDVSYLVKTTVSRLDPGYYGTSLLPSINITNQSILHIYFPDLGTRFLKRDESYRWYEYMSDCGGIFAFFVGFSLISLVELFYFSVLFLSELLEPEPYSQTIEEYEILHKQSSMGAIYWNELFPRSKNNVGELKRNDLLF